MLSFNFLGFKSLLLIVMFPYDFNCNLNCIKIWTNINFYVFIQMKSINQSSNKVILKCDNYFVCSPSEC